MSETSQIDPQPDVTPKTQLTEPESKEPETPETPEEDDSTVGTGTSMALGCIAGTIVLIVIALLFLAISALF